MARHSITINLFRQASIDEAIKSLKEYEKNVQQKTKLLCQRLAERGVDVAQAQIYDLDAVFTTELFHSIRAEKGAETRDTAIFYIVADSDHAIFVEFGTGYVGESNPYPYTLPSGYQYCTGTQLLANREKGVYGWVYYLEEENKFVFTEGMPSRPFMWSTSMELQRIISSVAKEVFGV